MVDIVTFELENIHIGALKQLKQEGKKVLPDPEMLEIIQDKGNQKMMYQSGNIPTSPFKLYTGKEEILRDIRSGTLLYPFVQKMRVGGYDGRGVSVINSENDLNKIFDVPAVVEQKIDIDKEIAVIAARNEKGEIKCFPTVEMVFDSQANLVEKLICPSTLSEEKSTLAQNIAKEIINLFDVKGLLAVEFFLDKTGKLWVNEVAPRPHNSGHHTIESIITSQFEQHLRAILNLPLGSTRLKMPAVMLNLLGEPGYDGPVKYIGLTESLAIEGVKIHLYGKKITRGFRKMGHITIIAPTLEEAIEKSEIIKKLIHVRT
jgi:5-(carboxyamino)imidazole ribonucleotide synthase